MSKRQHEGDVFTSSKGDSRQASFVQRMTALNQQFAAWVNEQSDKELWTDGVEDYLRHAKELVSNFGDVLDAPAPKRATPGAAGLFNFAPAPAEAASQPPPPAFNFGGLPGKEAAAAGGAAPFSGLNFGAGGGFNFGGAAAGRPAAAAADDDDEEAEEDNEPSVELESSDAEILSKHRVKLMSNMAGTWKPRGPGTLSIRRPIRASDAGTRAPYLVFTTDTGKVLLSAPLLKGVRPVVQAKQPATLMMMLINSAGGVEGEKGMHAFKCEGGEAAQALLAQVNSHV